MREVNDNSTHHQTQWHQRIGSQMQKSRFDIDVFVFISKKHKSRNTIDKYPNQGHNRKGFARQWFGVLKSKNSFVANQSITKEYGYTFFQGGIGIPIFNKAQKARIEAAKINQQVTESQIQTTLKQLQANLDILEQERQKYEKALNYYEKSALPQANLLVSTALKTYRAGDIEYVEFFQNVQQVAQIRENYLANQLNYSLIVIQIEKVLGQ